MIFNILLDIIFTVLTFILGLLPDTDSEVMTFLSTNVSGFFDILGGIDFLIPVNTLLWCIGIIMATETALLSFKVVKWIGSIVYRHKI